MFTDHLVALNTLDAVNEGVIPEGWVLISRGDTCPVCDWPLLCHEKICPVCDTKFEPSEPFS